MKNAQKQIRLHLQSPSPSRCKQSFMPWTFVISMCSDTVGVFDSKLVNAADSTFDLAVVVDVAVASAAAVAADVAFAGKIVALIDWIAVDNEPMLFGVEAILFAFFFSFAT